MKLKGKPVRVIGGRIFADGYFRIGRKMNYVGDLMNLLGMAIIAGLNNSLIPYALFVFILSFLLFRAK